jgi:hypothetical protein
VAEFLESNKKNKKIHQEEEETYMKIIFSLKKIQTATASLALLEAVILIFSMALKQIPRKNLPQQQLLLNLKHSPSSSKTKIS